MDEPKPRKKITDEKVALAKAEHYCAYQERSQQEARDKLYEWGLYPNMIENIITKLIAGNFLNEERFAKAYTSGKLNIKHWGKGKIKQGLKQKRVSEPLIRKALLTIDADTYANILQTVLNKKQEQLTERNSFKRQYKLIQYAMSRGFETELIWEVLKSNEL